MKKLILVTIIALWANFANAQCQQINAVLDSVATLPHPNQKFIDIPIGGTVVFNAIGSGADVFPQNNTNYYQSSATSLFIWDFSDGAANDTGLIVSRSFNYFKGFDIRLTVIDIIGCSSITTLVAKVRVSGNPIIGLNLPPTELCTPDTVFLTVGKNTNSNIVVNPITVVSNEIQGNHIATFIPDGPSCSTLCLNSLFYISGFPNGSIVQNSNDIKSICANIEHSFNGDLGFKIICPNGQNVQLDPNTHVGNAWLGVPFGDNGHDTYDNGCDPANNLPGSGWTYCWSEFFPQHGTLDSLSIGIGSIDSTNTVTNTNYLTPSNPLSGLIGCPLNGIWTLKICDDWSQDNGYLFNWNLEFNQGLINNWSYTTSIDTVIWTGQNVLPLNDSVVRIIFNNAGTYNYNASIINNFGVAFDTTFTIKAIKTPDIFLGNDTTLCLTSLILDPGTGEQYYWSNGSIDSSITVNSSGIYSVSVTNFNINHSFSCLSVDSVSVYFSIAPELNICYVDYDSASQKNKIYWNINLPANAESVHIYKEVSLNTWNYIGDVVLPNDFFIDIFSNPGSQSYSYKIATYDTCNNEGIHSLPHTTITLLSAYDSPSNTYGFTWSAYIGLSIADYKLYGIDAIGNYNLVGSVPGNQYFYNYVNPNPQYIKYFVGFDSPDCNSKSNYLVKSNFVEPASGVLENENLYNLVTIYPNPTSDELTIETSHQATIQILNIQGQLIKAIDATDSKTSVDVSELSSGMYFVEVKTENGVVVRKFVKE